MAKKKVYFFGAGKADGDASMKNLLGGKGANLAEMTKINVPVPAGFTIITSECIEFYSNKKRLSKVLKEEVEKNLKKTEQVMKMKFGDPKDPLLLSCRSGARVSMPGMMDTVLNIGLTDKTIKGLIEKTGDERFCYDSYRRLIQMYGDVVLGIEKEVFAKALDAQKAKQGVKFDAELTVASLKKLVDKYKAIVKKETGKDFPQTPMNQLWGAVSAVFGSWNTARAVHYRRMHKLPDDWGTAVNIQSMVFGNMGDDSATGVAFTRNPSTGENKFYGEYLVNAQGEDVVAGIRTPQPINIFQKASDDEVSLEEAMPEVYKELDRIQQNLEKHYTDMLDLEFTIQQGTLWMLQARVGKRTAAAAVRIAVEMVKEKSIKQDEAVLRVDPYQLDQLLHPSIDPKAKITLLAKGLPASPGAATGRAVFSANDAVTKAEEWGKVILVREETSPEDIHGMDAAQAILTARGGMTSHAAVVARGMGKPCVAGCSVVHVEADKKQFSVGNSVIKEGDFITIDGGTGRVIKGEVKTVAPQLSKEFQQLMSWADKFRKLKVRTNADTPKDSKVAREFGAEGIGLCRTEHMFFEGNRIDAVREMIVADTVEERRKALDKLLPLQREDFVGIFRAMAGLPVTIRALDPPLHEFLPQKEEEFQILAKNTGKSLADIKRKAASLHEFNPMLGHRGCRLGVVYPEITEMQARAIIEAACIVKKEKVKVLPEIMIPLVSHVNELELQKDLVDQVAKEVMKEKGVKVQYMVGTMIELPRAALTADKIAEKAEFFSFGTNDLTQTTFGLSRDDAGRFLPTYIENKVLPYDPFQTLDFDGVGKLVEKGIELGRSTRANLKVGICGEHGGDPLTVMYCDKVGMNYVSCSPFRVPLARLAAAHAALKPEGFVQATV